MSFKDTQLLKTLLHIVFMEFGIIIFSKFMQSSNKKSDNSTMAFGRVTDFKFEHPLNAA